MSEVWNLFQDILRPSNACFVSHARLDTQNPKTAIFSATLNGAGGRPVWARAWLSTEAGTLAESASTRSTAGDEVTLKVSLESPETPRFAYVRIESAPLHTEHVVGPKLTWTWPGAREGPHDSRGAPCPVVFTRPGVFHATTGTSAGYPAADRSCSVHCGR